MLLIILLYFLLAQHISGITMPIIRSCRLQAGHYSSLTAPNLQHAANQDRNDQCGNQHHSREVLMMGLVMPETY